MKQVIYFEYYPHYMGTLEATVRFTPKQFEELIGLAKAAVKEAEDDGPADVALEEYIDEIEEAAGVTLYSIRDAVTGAWDEAKRRPTTITTAMKKKGLWSGEWEEGSHAFATTERKARKAVAKIEAKHHEEEMWW